MRQRNGAWPENVKSILYFRTHLRVVVLVGEDAWDSLGYALGAVEREGLRVAGMRSFQLSERVREDLAALLRTGPTAVPMRVIVLRLQGPESSQRFKKCIPQLPQPSQWLSTQSVQEAQEVSNFFWKGPQFPRLPLEGCTVALILPHALKSHGSQIIETLLQSFALRGVEWSALERIDATDCLEVYQHVFPEFPELVTELSSGPSLALALAARDPNCSQEELVEQLRTFVGPRDPAVARVLRPSSIRGQWGVSLHKCAVLPSLTREEAAEEIHFFFPSDL